MLSSKSEIKNTAGEQISVQRKNMSEIDRSGRRPRCAIITCAVIEDEVRHFLRGLDHIARIDVLAQGLHNDPPKLRRELQAAVTKAEADPNVQAIVLGYGLCSRGIEDVVTQRVPMIIARAHDCITILLGSRKAYADYVARNPGTYWYSPGWNKHHLAPGQERYETLRAQYIAKYGEDDAEYLMEQEQSWFKAYDRATYVDLGVTPTDEDIAYTRECARWLKWNYDRVEGNPALLKALLSGQWNDEDFLILQPGETFRMTADERIIEAVPLTIQGRKVG
jgi:hypothetical protein